MVIVEGPDNSGKSTLIKQLKTELGLTEIPRLAHGPANGARDLCRRTYQIIDSVTKAKSHRIILDRFTLIGEDIYGPVLRNVNLWDKVPQEKVKFWRAVNLLNPFIIYCRPPEDVIMDMEHHVIKEYDTLEHIKKVNERQGLIIHAYDNYFANWKPYNFFRYNYKNPDSYNQLKIALKEYL